MYFIHYSTERWELEKYERRYNNSSFSSNKNASMNSQIYEQTHFEKIYSYLQVKKFNKTEVIWNL